jgi:hypothetical protein
MSKNDAEIEIEKENIYKNYENKKYFTNDGFFLQQRYKASKMAVIPATHLIFQNFSHPFLIFDNKYRLL